MLNLLDQSNSKVVFPRTCVRAWVTFLLLAGMVILSACTADAGARQNPPPAPSSATANQDVSRQPPIISRPPAYPCRNGGDSFAVAPVKGGGSVTPLVAAKRYAARPTVYPFGTPDAKWVVFEASNTEVTLTALPQWLHASLLTDKTWIIDSGGQCSK